MLLTVFLLNAILNSGCASSSKKIGDDPYYKEIPWPRSEYSHSVIGIIQEHTTYEAYDKGTLSRNPKIKYYVKPEYPSLDRRGGIEGDALLEVVVGTDGRVKDVKIVKSSVTPSMEISLLEAAKHFIYQPGKRGHKSIICIVRHLIRYKLNGDVVKFKID